MRLIPSRAQWRRWSLPAKASYLGVIIGLISFVAVFWPRATKDNNGGRAISSAPIIQTTTGPNSPAVAGTGGHVTIIQQTTPTPVPKDGGR